MKINYSKKLILGFAVLNIIFVGALFYRLIFKSDAVEEMNRRCNTEFIEDNLIGKALPKYEFVDGNESDAYQDLTQGRVLVVVFLTGCQACMQEFELLESHYKELSAKIRIVAVTGESEKIVERFVENYKPSFPVYLDVRGSLMLKTRVSCTPTMLFLENGIVRKIKVGMTKDYKDLMEVLEL